MNWIEFLIIGFVFFEALVISIHSQLQKINPEATIWVILGSKVLKLLLTIGVIFLIPRITEIPLKEFALTTVVIYFVSIVVESIFFLKKQKNEQTK